MVTTIIDKLHRLLDLADDIGGPQFREDIVALVVKPRFPIASNPDPIYRDLAGGIATPVALSLDWLYDDLDAFERFWGHEPDAILVTRRQQRQITNLLRTIGGHATFFNGIPLRVVR